MKGDSHENITEYERQTGNVEHDDSPIFQSTWIRHNSVLADTANWKYLARQFRYVFYCGSFLWALHAISLVIFS